MQVDRLVELALEEVNKAEWWEAKRMVMDSVGLATEERLDELRFEHHYETCNCGSPHP